jgi:hypothetical protein
VKVLQQFLIICAIAFVGDLLNGFVPLPVPGGCGGWCCCCPFDGGRRKAAPDREGGRLFDLHHGGDVRALRGRFFFNVRRDLEEVLELAVIILGSTAVTMVVTGGVVQKMRKAKKMRAGGGGNQWIICF